MPLIFWVFCLDRNSIHPLNLGYKSQIIGISVFMTHSYLVIIGLNLYHIWRIESFHEAGKYIFKFCNLEITKYLNENISKYLFLGDQLRVLKTANNIRIE